MKHLLFSFIFLVTLASSTFAQDGGCGGHGGDAISQEFYQTGESVVSQIKKLSSDELKSLPFALEVSGLELALEQTRVISTDEKLYKDGIEVDAKNYYDASARIEVNRARWLQYKDQKFKKYGIVLHEYLGILKAMSPTRGEWDEYSASAKILALLSKHEKSSTDSHRLWVDTTRIIFNQSAGNSLDLIERGMNFSCVEYSLLSNDIAPIPHLNAYSSSTLPKAIEEFTESQTDSAFRNEIRITRNGSLIILKTDLQTKAEVGLSYCSKLGSKSLQLVRFLSESILPIFDMPKTRSFAEYQRKIADLANTGAYRGCVEKENMKDCLRMVKKLDQIKLEGERVAVETAKSNIGQINDWLNSLPERERFLVNPPLLGLFSDYAAHQDYLRGLMDLNDSGMMHTPYNETKRDAIGLKNFIDSIQNRLPLAYEAAKARFLQQTTTREIEFIENFSLLF
jgi:hypothetical protein